MSLLCGIISPYFYPVFVLIWIISRLQYCSLECYNAYWKIHQPDCRNSPLSKPSWRPSWEARWVKSGFQTVPAFVLRDAPDEARPAIDVLNLKQNEGEGYDKAMDLLFVGTSRMIIRLPFEVTTRANSGLVCLQSRATCGT